MIKVLKPVWLGILSLFVAGVLGNAAAEQISVTTAFTCSTNAECKRKCEGLGSDHVWKPNPGGSTLGTCTKRVTLAPLSRELLETLNVVSKYSDAIEEELNAQLSSSPTLRKLGVSGAELGSFSILLKRPIYDGPPCASCTGSGVTVERCCYSNPDCFDPCTEGGPVMFFSPD